MVILDVIPLISLPRDAPQIVSYFYTDPLPRGTVVQVSFHNRKVKAVVIASAPLAQRKAEIKKRAMFTLKPITKILKNNVTEEQIKRAQELANYYFAPLGVCLRAVMLHPDEKNYKKYISPGPILDLPPLTNKRGRGEIAIVDMRKEIRDANYSIFSRTLKNALQAYDRLIIFIPRKGYANFLLCKDCGNAIKCKNCSASLVVHSSFLKCHHCNYQELKPKTCPACKSYNLKPYGVGIDKVQAELEKLFRYQNLKIPKISQLTAEHKAIPADWNILLATQALFNVHLPPVPFLAIMNADTLIHIPDYRAEEMLLRQTLALASMVEDPEHSRGTVLVQTYNPDDPALVAAATGTVKEFWGRELEYRKQFGYPPFTRLIKLTYRHRDPRIVQRVARNVAEKLGGVPYPALISRERGLYVWHVLLKIKEMTDATRYALHALPPDWHIDVDPISTV